MKITLNQARKATISLSILRTRQCPITTAFKLATFSDAVAAQVVRFEQEVNARIKEAGYAALRS